MPVEHIGGGLVRSSPDMGVISREVRPGFELRPEIIGFGKAHGSILVTAQETAQAMVDRRREEREIDPSLDEITLAVALRGLRSFGIGDRHFSGPEQASAYMATIAGRSALEMAGVTAKDIKNMPYATGLPDYMGVPTGTIVMKNLNGNYQAATADVGAACPGFIHAFRHAITDMTSEYGLGSPQMVIASEPASKGITKDYMKTWPLFGDAAGAIVLDMVEVDERALKTVFAYGMDPDMLHDLYVPAGGGMEPSTDETLRQGKHYIKMDDGVKVKKAAILNMAAIAKRLLQKSNLRLSDIDLIIPHQANQQIITGVRAQIEEDLQEKLPKEKVYVNIQRYGNSSAATIPVAMREAWEEDRIKKGTIVMGLSFGAGLNFGGFVMQMNGILEEHSPELSRFIEQELKAA